MTDTRTDSATAAPRAGRPPRRYRSRGQEAVVQLLRTADVVRRTFTAVVEGHGITLQQFNVLRILRGEHPHPLPTLEVGERMIEQQPGITRLLDRLEAKGLVRRQRCPEDRRKMHVWITDQGLEVLAELDEPVDRADDGAVAALDAGEVEEFLRLLEKVRRSE